MEITAPSDARVKQVEIENQTKESVNSQLTAKTILTTDKYMEMKSSPLSQHDLKMKYSKVKQIAVRAIASH
jgi:hypothetical protein